MQKLKRKLSFVRKRDLSEDLDDESKLDEWPADELKVRNGTCNFLLKYIGKMVVSDSKGIEVCEEASKKLIEQNPGPYKTVVFQVRGEHLKCVDEETGNLMLDQLVERVSFCAPNRQDPKGFAYICRDSVARQWVCHAFLAIKDKGERVSYAVGYAFNICMELRMMRETSQESGFKRSQSFRSTSMTDRRTDPQSTRLADPVPLKKLGKLQSTERPRPPERLKRQSSLVSLDNIDQLEANKQQRSKVHDTKVFKRQMSMKVEELSSILDRLNAKESQQKRNSSVGAANDSQLFDTLNENKDPAKPIIQSNPWCKKPPSRASAAERKIEADEWLLAVAKKASMLRKETGKEALKNETLKRVQMTHTQAHSLDSPKNKTHAAVATSNMGGSFDKGTSKKGSKQKEATDPFDTDWAQKLASKGKNPFGTRSATISS